MRQLFKDASDFLRRERKWWLVPLVLSILILAALVLLTMGPSPLSPFMYSVK